MFRDSRVWVHGFDDFKGNVKVRWITSILFDFNAIPLNGRRARVTINGNSYGFSVSTKVDYFD